MKAHYFLLKKILEGAVLCWEFNFLKYILLYQIIHAFY